MNTSRPCRRRWRLHLSTWLVVAAVVALLVLLILPGYDEEFFEWAYPDQRLEAELHHGWPWTFLTRRCAGPPARVAWLSPAGWSMRGDDRRFVVSNLAYDGGLALAVVVVVAALFEFRRRRRARFWQFSLKEVGCFVTAAAVVSAYEGWKYRTYRREQSAKSTIVGFDLVEGYEGPMWLKRLAGYEIPYHFAIQDCLPNDLADDATEVGELRQFQRLQYLDLEGQDVTDETLLGLFSKGGLSNVGELYLAGAHESDAGLASLSRCRKLRVLHVSGMSVRGEFLKSLTCAECLEEVNFAYANIADEALVDLVRFPRLKYLNLSGTHVTDRGLATLASMPRLQLLSLSGTAISDVGLAHLARLPDLQAIDVSNTAVSADGLLHVPNVRYLDIGGTKIDDSDLPKLLRLPSLQKLQVPQAITDEAKARLESGSSCSVEQSMSGRVRDRFEFMSYITSRWPGEMWEFVDDPADSQ